MTKIITRDMVWFVLIAIVAFAVFWTMGFASVESSERSHRHEIECIQHGGNIELVVGSGPTCIKK
jgi:hypothetical protein